MTYHRRAKITVNLDNLGWSCSKFFVGTEDEVYAEAHDWMNAIALNFIEGNAIEDPDEQDLIIESATHTIEWEDDMAFCMYAVYENDYVQNPIYGIYATRADAEEAIFTECEHYVYEIMMTANPLEVYGEPSWHWKIDYKWLMEDALQTFTIQEVPVFGIVNI